MAKKQVSLTKTMRERIQSIIDANPSADNSLITAALKAAHPEYARYADKALEKHVAALKTVRPTAMMTPGAMSAEPATPYSGAEEATPTPSSGAVLPMKRPRPASLNAQLPYHAAAPDTPSTGRTRRQARAKDRAAEPAPTGGAPGAAAASEASGWDRPSERYINLGGMESVLAEVRQLIEYPLTHPEIYSHLGVEPPRGILLHGPPGCGKTSLARAIAGETGVYFRNIAAPEVVSGLSGESEEKLRRVFAEAAAAAPAIIFIDEIDCIASKREGSQRSMERRIVAQLMACMDGLTLEATGGAPVLVLGATNSPDSLDPSLRRAGRFDREICLGIPDEPARERILAVLVGSMSCAPDVTLAGLARATPGYVGADLVSLAREAAVEAVKRVFGQLLLKPAGPASGDAADSDSGHSSMGDDSDASEHDMDASHAQAAETAQSSPELRIDTPAAGMASLSLQQPEQTPAPVTPAFSSAAAAELARLQEFQRVSDRLREMPALKPEQLAGIAVSAADFAVALKKVQPSATREGFATIPNVTWADVGALSSVRAELRLAIVEPIAHPEKFAALGLTAPAGVLLYGPPGCGKTLLAKAIANESRANFISVKGPELLDKFVGESERAVRQVFTRAAASAPCVVFFDEIDALAPRRGRDGGSGGVSERVVNQLLTELDGLNTRGDVFVVAATNRPDIMDAAMLRPGRLDKLCYVPLPTASERVEILRTHLRKVPCADDVDVHALAHDERADRYSGADCAGFVREAAYCALRRTLNLDDEPSESEPAAATTPAGIPRVTAEDFESAFGKVLPSVSARDVATYNSLQSKLRASRGAVA